MCCCYDPKIQEEFLKRFAKRKTIKVWKTVDFDGLSLNKQHKYKPGKHVVPVVGEYDVEQPQGIHVWLEQPTEIALEVKVHIDDFVVAGWGAFKSPPAQAVFQKVSISRKDWKQWQEEFSKQVREKFEQMAKHAPPNW